MSNNRTNSTNNMVKTRKNIVTKTQKPIRRPEDVPSSGARSAPELGLPSGLRRTSRAGARHDGGPSELNCPLEKLSNAKGQLGSAHQSDNSFTELSPNAFFSILYFFVSTFFFSILPFFLILSCFGAKPKTSQKPFPTFLVQNLSL